MKLNGNAIKIIFASLFTMVMIIVFFIFNKDQVHPLNIRIELRSDAKNELCQLFYIPVESEKKIKSQDKNYYNDQNFQVVEFSLPFKDYKYLRIDPGVSSDRYEIRKITLLYRDLSVTYSDSAILKNFNLYNLKAVPDRSANSLILSSSGNHDVQMHFKNTPGKLFSDKRTHGFLIKLALIYLAGLILIFFFVDKLYFLALKYTGIILSSERYKEVVRKILLVIFPIFPFIPNLILSFSKTLLLDWGYFNGQSLFIRSSVLNYLTFPVHNPWLSGGQDLLAIPQSRVFSPFVILDILLTPPLANLFSLIILAIVGSFGVYKLLCYLKINRTTALVISILFIHGNWFSLHFSVGHIIFGSFQLMGFCLYYIFRIYEKRYKFYFSLLLSFFLLHGSVYAMVFSILLFIISLIFQLNGLSLIGFFRSIKAQYGTVFISALVFLMLSSVKIVPFLQLLGSGTSKTDYQVFPVKNLLFSFFNPLQSAFSKVDGEKVLYPYHEYGNYLGLFGFLLVLFYLIANRKQYHDFLGYVFSAIFFFWLSSGWLKAVNPSWWFVYIPFFNNIHVHPRLLIFVFLFYMILLGQSLNYFKGKFGHHRLWLIYGILIFEYSITSWYPYFKINNDKTKYLDICVFNSLIKSTGLDKTIGSSTTRYGYGDDFLHYYHLNTGSKDTYDPYKVRGFIRAVTDSNYKGEIYFRSGSGTAEIAQYTPGRILVHYHTDTVSIIEINTNYLAGWRTADKNVKIFKNNGLLNLYPKNKTGTVLMKYRPDYLYYVIPMYLLGILISILIIFSKNPFSDKPR